MRILIAGANGQIGRKLIALIAASAHSSRGMIRKAEQADTLRKLGADEIVVADLEGDMHAAVAGCEAIVFAAGSGGDTGPEKTDAVDRDGAIALMDAARQLNVQRFVMVSSMGADNPRQGPESLRHYLRAKQSADQHLVDSGLDYTIVRPGHLVDNPATGNVVLAPSIGRSGEVSRADVAAVLLVVLSTPSTVGKTFEMLQGNVSIAQAVAEL